MSGWNCRSNLDPLDPSEIDYSDWITMIADRGRRREARRFWWGYVAGVVTVLGLLAFVVLWSCAPVNQRDPYTDDAYLPWNAPIPTTIMHFGMRDSLDYGERDGIFHGRVVGETEPFLFGFVGRMSHVLVMHQMTGANVPTLTVTIEIYKSRGKP